MRLAGAAVSFVVALAYPVRRLTELGIDSG
jgi:hypothetical protein